MAADTSLSFRGGRIDSRDGDTRKSADSAGDVSLGTARLKSTIGLRGEACALERSDAPIRNGASSAVRASRDSSALSIAVRSEAGSVARRRTHASATSKAPSRPPRPRRRAHAPQRGARAPERSPAASFASARVARLRGSYHSAVRRLRASASARSSTLVAAVRFPSASSAAPRNTAASTRENTLPRGFGWCRPGAGRRTRRGAAPPVVGHGENVIPKCRRYGGRSVDPMVSPAARAATIKL